MPEGVNKPRADSRLERLNHVLKCAWEQNVFYQQLWTEAGLTRFELTKGQMLGKYPFVTRTDFHCDQTTHPPFGRNLSDHPSRFIRVHQSSGSSGDPIFWLDTPESWEWVKRASGELFKIAGVRQEDQLFFDLPFRGGSGPWILYEGAGQLGCGRTTAGDSSAEVKLNWIQRVSPTILVGRAHSLKQLAEALRAWKIDPASLRIGRLILTGSRSADDRQAAEQIWGAAGLDRYGMTEAGSIAAECPRQRGRMHLLDNEFIAEVIDPKTARPLPGGEEGELVLTTLGRVGRPIIRYRTGDLVRLRPAVRCECGRTGSVLEGTVRRREPFG